MRPPVSGWSLDWAEQVLVSAFEEERRGVIPVAVERVRNRELDHQAAEVFIIHEAWNRVARRLGLRYGQEMEDVE
jgi:hypothetical protein